MHYNTLLLTLFISIFLLILSPKKGLGQQVNVDSLYSILNSNQHDTLRINAALKLAVNLSMRDRNRSEILAKEALLIAKKSNHKKATAEAYYVYSVMLELRNADTDSIFTLFNQGLEIVEKNNKRHIKILEAKLLNAKGETYKRIGLFDKALEVYYKSLDISRQFNIKRSQVIAWNGIADIQEKQQNFDEALKYLKYSLPIAREINKDIDYCLQSIAYIYQSKGKLDSALIMYKEAMEVSRSLNNDLGVAVISNNIGQVYNIKKEAKLAKKYLKEAMAISKRNNYIPGIIGALQELTDVAYNEKEYDKALSYALQELDLLSKYENLAYQMSNYRRLSLIYTEKRNYKEALEYMEKASIAKDSLYNLETSQQIEELSTKFEVKQTEIENQKLKVEKQQRSILGIAGIILATLMAIIAVLQKRARDLKNQQNKLLEQKVVERTQELAETSQELAEVKHIQLLEEAKNRFFANVSHEFRTPLTLIQGPLTALQNNGRLNIKDNNMVKRALQNTKQLLRLVNQILDLTKFDSSQLTLNETPEVFYLLIRRLVANFETYTQSKNIALTLEYLPKAELQIKIDKDKFEKVFNNYLSNAIKFTPNDGEITVKIQDLENRLQIAVADTGIGIAEDKLETVFERFYQVQQDDNAPLGQVSHYAGGTGIGLSLCKEYAALMNGNAWAESPNTSGKGSTFFFEFPKKEVVKPIDEKTKNAIKEIPQVSDEHNYLLPANGDNGDASSSIDNNNTILLVEDNYDLRDFITTLLSDKYKIIAVEHGQAALNQLNIMNDLPSLIISDVMMPVMDGFQLIEKLKSSEAFRHIPVMMLTARADMQDKLKALRIGVDDYMLKPFVNNELLVRVDNLILNFNSRKEMYFVHTEEVKPKVKITHTTEDTAWLQDLEKVVTEHITDFKLNADRIAEHMNVSRSKLFRKTKKITGLTVNDYIKELRLQKARNMIETGEAQSTKEVAYSVGYKHVDYFAQSYEKRFGKRPSSYFN